MSEWLINAALVIAFIVVWLVVQFAVLPRFGAG